MFVDGDLKIHCGFPLSPSNLPASNILLYFNPTPHTHTKQRHLFNLYLFLCSPLACPFSLSLSLLTPVVVISVHLSVPLNRSYKKLFFFFFCIFLLYISCKVMTRPKFRPCPSCQTPSQASRKTCHVCFGSLSTKQKIKDKALSLDRKWGQSVVKSRNVGRLIDSARIAVQKLEAVGYKPILFIAKQDKKTSNKWVADVITHLHPTPVTRNVLENMREAYECILTEETSTAQQLDNDIPIAEQHNSPSQEQCNSSILKPESLTMKQPESISMELSEKRTKTSICSPAPSATSVSPPSLFTTELSPPQSLPAASSISQPWSQEGPYVKKGREGCRKCSRQTVFLFDKITGERMNEGNAELKVHWLPCTVCGKIWDDTWEPAGEFQHFLTEVPHPTLSELKF